jgi:YD repeat-containing protein
MRVSTLAAVVAVLVASASVGATPPAEDPDRVITDASGREVSRIRTMPDGTTEISRVAWAGQTKHAVSTEVRDATGRIVHRKLERLDVQGRLTELRDVDVDARGHERGAQTRYTYDAKGTRREQTLPIE